jgi:Flp pilus assembly protein TadD
MALAAQGKFDEALQFVQEELALVPGSVDGWNTLGIVHARQGKFAEARTAFEAAIQRNRRDIRPYRNRCQTFLDEAIRSDGSVDPSQLRLAIQHFRQFTTDHPHDADGRQRLAEALLHAGRVADSLREWEIYIRLRPSDPLGRERLDRLRALVNEQSHRPNTVSR